MEMPVTKMTLGEYMAWEEVQPEKNEFHRGEVFAMVGARRGHARVLLNLGSELSARLKGTPCQVFVDSMKVQIGDDTVLYPDVFVTCERDYSANDLVCKEPVLVIEVLSPSTRTYDANKKFTLYRRLASLREYVLIDPETRDVNVYRRSAADEWTLHVMTERADLVLATVDATIPFAEIFDGIEPAT